jgi:maleate isomerase
MSSSSERKKIGIVIPSSNTTLERDFHLATPDGLDVSYHSSRMWTVDSTVEELERMNQDAETAAALVATAEVDVIAYGCTSGSFMGGPGADQRLAHAMGEAAGGIPVVTTSTASVQAMKHLGLSRLSVVTPYTDSINDRLPPFLEGNGLTALDVVGRQISRNLEIGIEAPDAIFEFAMSNWAPEADGMFLSCTNWRSMEAVARLEAALGKPAVTANQATIWAAFRAAGITAPVRRFGRLMESLGQPVAV